MAFKYPPFQGDLRLLKAANNNPPLQKWNRGSAVVLLQAALVDVGFPMPRSIKKSGRPDGIYGPETYGTVYAFQTKHKLQKDGIAGRQTIGKLDTLLSGKPLKASPVLPKIPKKTPSTRHYHVGTADPPRSHDPGAGPWNSRKAELTMIALKSTLITHVLPAATVLIGDDAVKHMLHYLGNSGRPYTIDLKGMVNEVPSAKKLYQNEVAQASKFVELLEPGTYDITSKNLDGGYNYKSENRNWYFAVGGYSVWGKGKATVRNGAAGRECELDFEYHFYDRYNWDKGKSVKIGGIEITDSFMGEFHRQGLAREYDEVGMFRRKFRWQAGTSIPSSQIEPGGR